jgi:hypothetical protein
MWEHLETEFNQWFKKTMQEWKWVNDWPHADMPPNKKAKGADSQVECDSNDVSV